VENVEEFVIPKGELLKECESHQLKYCQDFSIQEVWPKLQTYYPQKGSTKPHLSQDDWTVLNLFRAYVFQKQ
jgi:hypothetical protein